MPRNSSNACELKKSTIKHHTNQIKFNFYLSLTASTKPKLSKGPHIAKQLFSNVAQQPDDDFDLIWFA